MSDSSWGIVAASTSMPASRVEGVCPELPWPGGAASADGTATAPAHSPATTAARNRRVRTLRTSGATSGITGIDT